MRSKLPSANCDPCPVLSLRPLCPHRQWTRLGQWCRSTLRDGEVLGTIARPMAQMLARTTFPLDDITFVLHTSSRAVNEAVIREALKRANQNLAAYNFISLDEAAARAHTTERFIFVLVSSFGLLGLLLAAVGLYGLLSLQVARRQREFGIRSALG